MYQMREVLLEPAQGDWPIGLEARETYVFLLSAFISTAFLSAMAFTACFSFHLGFRWAQYLWLAFSGFLFVCIGSAVFIFGAVWTFYLFEIGVVTASLFLLVRVQEKVVRDNMSIDTEPHIQKAASPQQVVVRSSSR